jgi:hypothetical protein
MKTKIGNVGAITLVLSGVTIIIGVLVFYNVYQAIPTSGLPGVATNAILNVSAQFAASIQLLTVGLIVLAAAIVLGYLFLIRG